MMDAKSRRTTSMPVLRNASSRTSPVKSAGGALPVSTCRGGSEKVQMQGTASICSGYLEMANVQTVSEMVNLISISRAYEANQKLIQTYDDSLEIAVSQLGRLS